MFLRENEIGSKVAPWLEPGQTLLDLGAGTGFISRWLRDHTGVRPTLTDVVSYRNRERSLEFVRLFKERNLSIVHVDTYRPKWPTLMTYPHSAFVLDR